MLNSKIHEQRLLHHCDSLLEALKVIAVTPAPDSRQLLITVTCADRPIDATATDEILAPMKVRTPRLCAEIARSITRRKTANLSFQYSHSVG